MELNFKPKISVGDFVFNTEISEYNRFDFDFVKCADDDKTGWDTYLLINPRVNIYTEGKNIVSISSDEQFLWKGHNLIGFSFDRLYQIFDNPIADEEDELFVGEEDKKQKVYEFDDLGMQVWVKDGIIVKVYANAVED